MAFLQDKQDTIGKLPIVLWHGLGDTYSSEGIKEISEILNEALGVFVYSIYVDRNPLNDRNDGFFGNVNDQIESVANQLSNVPELQNGFNAIGFSQGGLFLRGYIERYNQPPVYNLITFGTPHYGISDFHCFMNVFVCKAVAYFIKHAIWSWVKDNVVVAQYYRDTDNMNEYLEYNVFLSDINNEKDIKNATYAKNLASLNSFVMVQFKDDHLVIPKGSTHFNDYDKSLNQIIYLRDTLLYKEDWIGLKQLDNKKALIEMTVPGEHMELDYVVLLYLVRKYFANIEQPENIVQWQVDD